MEMKIRNPQYIFLPALFLLISISFLPAQTTRYFLSMESAEPRVIQPPLSWNDDEKTLRYEVIIEKETNEGYRQVLRRFTDVSFLNVFLQPGKYRYRVIPYNFLNRVDTESVSDWKDFDVIPTYKPELYDFSPSIFYVDKTIKHELILTGKNIDTDTRIYLRPIGSVAIVADEINIIAPVEKKVNKDGSVMVLFDNSQLTSGNYEVMVRNPGGKAVGKEGFKIVPFRSGKKIDDDEKRWYFDQAYLNIGGMYWNWNQFFDPIMISSNAVIHLSFVRSSQSLFTWGIFLGLSWYTFEADSYGYATGDIGGLIQMWLPGQSAAFCAMLSIGPSVSLSDMSPDMSVDLHLTPGLFFKWFPIEHLFFDFGFDYVLFKNYLRPCLSVGYKW